MPELYDDGGWSGGTMNRPAITQLLGDIKAGKVDVIVVYKVDRLSVLGVDTTANFLRTHINCNTHVQGPDPIQVIGRA